MDGVVKKAWEKIYDGIGGCIETAVGRYFNKYARYILKAALSKFWNSMVRESTKRSPRLPSQQEPWMDGARRNWHYCPRVYAATSLTY